MLELPHPLQVHYHSDTTLLCSAAQTLIVIALGPPPDAEVALADQCLDAMCQRWPSHSLSIMLCLHPRTRPPDGAARQRVTQVLKHPKLRHCCWVVLGSGFLAATIRSVVTSYVLATTQTLNSKVFQNVPSAVAWLRQQPSQDPHMAPPPEMLATSLNQLLAQLLPHEPPP